MNKQIIEERLRQFVKESEDNYIKRENALSPQLV